jgi:Flp pilus assembly protein TadD
VLSVGCGLIIVAALACTARVQASYWRDSEILWTHAIAVTRDNGFADASLADLLIRKGRLNDAIVHCKEALRIRPNDANAENNLGLAYLQLGNERDAAAHFENSLRNSPSNLNARTNLAWILATSIDDSLRDGRRAVELASSVIHDSRRENSIVLRTLAAALAETGNFSEAIDTAQRALQAANATGDTNISLDLERNIEGYRLNRPLRSRAP